jgi:hypothetical protein
MPQYRLRKTIEGRYCVYCGEIASCQDHFPPISVTRIGLLLPACHECNGLAGTDWSSDFWERCELVKNKLRGRYARWLNTPDWDDEEIAELGYNLRTNVTAWQEQKKIARTRIAWNAEPYLASIDHNSYFVQMHVEIGISIRNEKAKLRSIDAGASPTRQYTPNLVSNLATTIATAVAAVGKWQQLRFDF